MDYEEAWNLIKTLVKDKYEKTQNADRKISYGHVLGLMESYEKEISSVNENEKSQSLTRD